jgi:uncharacterized membrane protein
MSTFIVTIVPGEAKAYQAVRALEQLHADGHITVYDTIVVQRQADGTLVTKEREPKKALATGAGAVLGSLIGIFGGPIGFLAGAAAGGALVGGTAAVRGEVSDEFLEDIGNKMLPGMYAVLAEASEPWTEPVDARMRELGAIVIRERRSDVVDELMDKRVQAHKLAVEQRKADRAARKAERREAKLDDSIDQARDRLQRVADKARLRLEDTRRELEDKLAALDEQAKQAPPETRREIEARVAELRKDFGERERTLTHAFEVAQQALQ